MSARRTLACVALAGVLAWAPPARADDEPQADLTTCKVDELLRRLESAGAAQRASLEAELRRRGTHAVPAIRKARRDAAANHDRVLERILGAIREDWHKAHVPSGMLYIPAGYAEEPRTSRPWGPRRKRRWVDAFYIDKLEVSVAQWRAWRRHLREEGGARAVRRIYEPPDTDDGALPVCRVSWNEAGDFARRYRKGRLPRAEEFDRALRGSGLRTYPWGEMTPAGRANLQGFGPEGRVAVGSYPKGASPFGVLDLVGNVAEWSATTGPGGTARRSFQTLYLGGSYRDVPDPGLTWRGRTRSGASAGSRIPWVGFRVARDVPPLPDEKR